MENPNPVTFNIKHLYEQQRLKNEDRYIRVTTKFVPDLRTAGLSWKFYSRYRHQCDSCKCQAKLKPENINPNLKSKSESGDAEPLDDAEKRSYDGCNCALYKEDYSGGKSAEDKFSEYMKLVEDDIGKSPLQKYGHLKQAPLTSHDYGWMPADLFTRHHDEKDRKRFNFKTTKSEFIRVK